MTIRHAHSLFLSLSMVVSLLTGSNVKFCAIGFCRKSVYAISPVIRMADANLIPIDAKYVLN